MTSAPNSNDYGDMTLSDEFDAEGNPVVPEEEPTEDPANETDDTSIEEALKDLPRPFVPLHLHTHYSLLDGATKIPDLIDIAKESNFPAVAITDNGAMYGAVEFFNKATAAGIKPIIGADMYVIAGNIEERNRETLNHVTLLVKNQQGYQNLTQLLTTANLKGFYYKPRINWDILKEHSEGLICLTSGLSGPLARCVMRGAMEEARDEAKRLKEIFGDDVYVEIQDHLKEAEHQYTTEAVKIAQELGIEIVMTNDSRFNRREDEEVHKILMCMQEGKTVHDSSRLDVYGPEYYIKNGDEMAELFRHIDPAVKEQALENTLKVADKIDFTLRQGESILPDFPLPEGVTAEEELSRVVMESLSKRYDEVTEEIKERAQYELDIINQMGFPAYFLITADFIQYARDNDIPVGPGRGSAAGSIVAFVLEITDIDPIEHKLLFERFLNPERVSMPDIDIDFCIENREKVINYVTEKYGRECVSQIITFGTLAARAALKAVARVYDIPFAESDKLAKMIPAVPGTKLKDALEKGMELQQASAADPQVKELVDLALKIEGTACNTGVHAAGVIISKDPLATVAPLQNSKEGGVVATYPMGDLEKLGLLKMDFLGLRNLTIIENTIKLVKQTKGDEIDIRNLPLDDKKVYEMLTEGDTNGVFQLESDGMKALVKNLKPSVFDDIGALVALYRPGPLNSGMVDQFVDRKHGRQRVEFKHPDLEPILEDTYGTIVYQEQIMQVAQGLAGYTLGQADLLRRAMGKKKADVMEKERDNFLSGTEENNIDSKISNDLFDIMSEFAAYCFNRSHSAAYALVAYQTAYLKAHYPVEYLSALLSSVRNDLDKIQFYIVACREMGIKILPPDVSHSGINFTPDGDSIRFGLASVKNVGISVVEKIIEAREEKPFESFSDFLERVDTKALNRKTLEALILSGAFEEFDYSRKQLFDNVEAIIAYASKAQLEKETGQVNLFAAMGGDNSDTAAFAGLTLSGDTSEYTEDEIQRHEKSLLGFYVSSHPLDSIIDTLPMMVSHETMVLKGTEDGTEVLIGGLVSRLDKRMTKKNKPIWIGVLEDLTGSIEFVMFSESTERLAEVVAEGEKLIISGKLQFRGDNGSIIVNDARPITQAILLDLHFSRVPQYEEVATMGRILSTSRGHVPVILHFPDGTRIKTGHRFWVDATKLDHVATQLQQYFSDCLNFTLPEGAVKSTPQEETMAAVPEENTHPSPHTQTEAVPA